jgi:photosystem II stability/assembly factor-like uncharacterized protein
MNPDGVSPFSAGGVTANRTSAGLPALLVAMLILVTAVPAAGQPQWHWQAPMPFGAFLTGISCASPEVCVVVGSHGFAAVTTDGGITWTEQLQGDTGESLNDVAFVDVNDGLAVGTGRIIRTSNGGASWASVHTGSSVLTAISRPTANVAVVVGYGGAALRSTDGGETWSVLATGSSAALEGVDCVDANVCTAVGHSGTILRTTDGGASWTGQESGTAVILRAVHFFDANTGFAVGFNGTVLYTADAGATWNPRSSGTTLPFFAVKFFDDKTGLATGLGGLFRTSDGGLTWAQASGVAGNAISTTTSGIAFTAGPIGYLQKSGDLGATWTSLNSRQTDELDGVSFFDADHGLAVGAIGSTARTDDGGRTWEIGRHLAASRFWDVVMLSRTHAVAAATMGLFHTADGGQTWSKRADGIFYGVSFGDAMNGIGVGHNGQVRRTSDGGLSWSDASSAGGSRHLQAVAHLAPQVAVAVGDNGSIVRTDDGGGTWSTRTSGTTFGLRDVHFADAAIGMAVGFGGTILRTVDGGESWEHVTSGTTETLNGVWISDGQVATVVGNQGMTLWTEDGGASWSRLRSHTSNALNAVTFVDRGIGTMVGFAGMILAATPGAPTGTSADPLLPPLTATGVHSNYPNPFRSSTAITFELSAPTNGRLDVFDMQGRHVAVLFEGERGPGRHEITWDAGALAPGVYISVLRLGHATSVRKMVVVR